MKAGSILTSQNFFVKIFYLKFIFIFMSLELSDVNRSKVYLKAIPYTSTICNLILHLFKRLSTCIHVFNVESLKSCCLLLIIANLEPIKDQHSTVLFFVDRTGFE